MANILVTGSAHGLGAALVTALRDGGHDVYEYDHAQGYDVREPDLELVGPLDILINNAAINRINWLQNVSEEEWDTVIDTNVKGIYKMTQACLGRLVKSQGTVVNIVSNAAHMPMTCSLAYNASKGAADIMTKQLARELTKAWGITVFGIAPNKMAGTLMSESIDEQVMKTRGWTREQTVEYQLKGLLTGMETPPARVAEFVAFLLSSKERHQHLSGCILPYGI